MIWAGVTILLVAGIVWFVHARVQQSEQADRRSRPSVPVVTAPVSTGDLPVTLTELGTVTPLATVTVKTQINGRLVTVGFQEGQLVKTGDFLAQIDPRPYQIALELAKAQLVRDTALLSDARIDVERYRTLAAQDSIPRQRSTPRSTSSTRTRASSRPTRPPSTARSSNLEYCRTRPLAGRLGLRQIDPGNYVQTSDAGGIVVITQLEPISVIFTVPEDNVSAIVTRLNAGAKLPVIAYDRALTTKLATGALTTLDNQIDTTTGTVRLRAQFDNRDNRLFPHQFVTTILVLDTLKNATVVPSAAVQRGAPGTFVYVVNDDRVVNLRPVKLGPTDGDRVAVTSGVNAGERVVVDGADKLRNGAQVTLATEPNGPSGAAGARRAAGDDGARRSRRRDTP